MYSLFNTFFLSFGICHILVELEWEISNQSNLQLGGRAKNKNTQARVTGKKCRVWEELSYVINVTIILFLVICRNVMLLNEINHLNRESQTEQWIDGDVQQNGLS